MFICYKGVFFVGLCCCLKMKFHLPKGKIANKRASTTSSTKYNFWRCFLREFYKNCILFSYFLFCIMKSYIKLKMICLCFQENGNIFRGIIRFVSVFGQKGNIVKLYCLLYECLEENEENIKRIECVAFGLLLASLCSTMYI